MTTTGATEGASASDDPYAHYYAQQYYNQRPQRMSLVDYIYDAAARRVAGYVVGAAEYSVWWGWDKTVNTYRYFFPLTAEQMRAKALFSRRDFDGFIKKALDRNELSLMLPAHRISDDLRRSIERDGYVVAELQHEGIDALRIGFAPVKRLEGLKPPRASAK